MADRLVFSAPRLCPVLVQFFLPLSIDSFFSSLVIFGLLVLAFVLYSFFLEALMGDLGCILDLRGFRVKIAR
ncbi:hypothetical protein BJX99DRAFT_68255 [Aspergillus californicus]